MRVVFSDRALESLKDAPVNVRRVFEKQPRFLVNKRHYPSVRAKKYDESQDLWQGRVSRNWRLYFTIADDVYRIEDVTPHPK